MGDHGRARESTGDHGRSHLEEWVEHRVAQRPDHKLWRQGELEHDLAAADRGHTIRRRRLASLVVRRQLPLQLRHVANRELALL